MADSGDAGQRRLVAGRSGAYSGDKKIHERIMKKKNKILAIGIVI
mgnify:CR=1 FL=1